MVTKALREFRVAVSSGVNRGKGVEKRETSGAKKLGRWRSGQKIYSLEWQEQKEKIQKLDSFNSL